MEKNYQDILNTKKEILKNSLKEEENHIDKKCQQINEEMSLMRKQLTIVNLQIDRYPEHHSSTPKNGNTGKFKNKGGLGQRGSNAGINFHRKGARNQQHQADGKEKSRIASKMFQN